MEEPELGSDEGRPVIFTAVEGQNTRAAGSKKSTKSSSADKLKARKPTPRPILKGPGRKRFTYSPSPSSKQGQKRTLRGAVWSGGKKESSNKRNLLDELNVAAETSETAGKPQSSVFGSEGKEGAGIAMAIASPLSSDEGVGIDVAVASPLREVSKGVGTELLVASPYTSSGVGEGIDNEVASPRQAQGMERSSAEEEAGATILVDKPIDGTATAVVIFEEALGGKKGKGDGSRYTQHGKKEEGSLTLESHVKHQIAGEENLQRVLGSNDGRHHPLRYAAALKGDEGQLQTQQFIPESCVGIESMMDVCATQPLRGKALVSTSQETGEVARNQQDSEFPPLSAGKIRAITQNFEKLGAAAGKGNKGGETSGLVLKGNQRFVTKSLEVQGDMKRTGNVTGAWGGAEENGRTPSLAERIKNGEANTARRNPVTFEPNRFKKIGSACISEGRPTIVFSSEDTKFLADKMGYTIVGKFSHTIPSTTQIRKALKDMNLVGEYSWRYINAKHIAIKVEDPNDYALLLIGQNGVPVWPIDHHPMRVFKWTIAFNPYFETPIAAVWCNIIGLPIHLFEKSALFAIGGLLGNPIQLDHATADQSRLSFARICVEVDISKPTLNEVVVDMMGKESTFRVVWDKIPHYCKECHHVGHESTRCLAMGNNGTSYSNRFNGDGGAARDGKRQERFQDSRASKGKGQGVRNSDAKGTNSNDQHKGNFNGRQQGSYIWKERNHNKEQRKGKEVDEEGFIRQGRRREHKEDNRGIPRTKSAGDVRSQNGENVNSGAKMETRQPYEGGASSSRAGTGGGGKHGFADVSTLAKPSYYQQLENGEFITGDTDDEIEMEVDPKTYNTDNLRILVRKEHETPNQDLLQIVTVPETETKEGQSTALSSYSIRC